MLNNNLRNNINQSTNNEQNTNTLNGGSHMINNRIKLAREQYQAEQEAKAKEEAKQQRLASIEPVDIIDTIDEVHNNIARAVRNESGNSIGTNGGKLYQKPIATADGHLTTIAADSQEALDELEKNIALGLQGDGKYHKLVYIGGIPCDCAGKTLEELEEDIAAAEDYYKAHNGHVLRDIDVAEQLIDAGYEKKDLKQVEGSDGNTYLIDYGRKALMGLDGYTVVDLSELESKLTDEDIEKLLVEKLEKHIEEIAVEEEECDEYDEEDEDLDEYYEEEYDEDSDDDDDEGGWYIILG